MTEDGTNSQKKLLLSNQDENADNSQNVKTHSQVDPHVLQQPKRDTELDDLSDEFSHQTDTEIESDSKSCPLCGICVECISFCNIMECMIRV